MKNLPREDGKKSKAVSCETKRNLQFCYHAPVSKPANNLSTLLGVGTGRPESETSIYVRSCFCSYATTRCTARDYLIKERLCQVSASDICILKRRDVRNEKNVKIAVFGSAKYRMLRSQKRGGRASGALVNPRYRWQPARGRGWWRHAAPRVIA